jgi:hypothetical protein
MSYPNYTYGPSQGNTTGTTVALDVPKWTESTSLGTHDYWNADHTMLLRLDFTSPGTSAVTAWKTEEQSFAALHTGYDRITIHSVNCPDGAVDCADWELTFTQSGVVQRAIDRAIITTGPLGFAVYFRASQTMYASSVKIFQHVVDSIRLRNG